MGEGIPWAHLDIAGTAWWAEGDQAEFANGGTGYGVRLAARAGPHLHPAQARSLAEPDRSGTPLGEPGSPVVGRPLGVVPFVTGP